MLLGGLGKKLFLPPLCFPGPPPRGRHVSGEKAGPNLTMVANAPSTESEIPQSLKIHRQRALSLGGGQPHEHIQLTKSRAPPEPYQSSGLKSAATPWPPITPLVWGEFCPVQTWLRQCHSEQEGLLSSVDSYGWKKKGVLKITQAVRVATMHHQQPPRKDSAWLIDSFRGDVPKPFNVFSVDVL